MAFAGTIHDPAAQAHPDAASEVHPGISSVRPIGATTNSAYRSFALARCALIKRAANVGFLGGERRNTEIAEYPFLNPERSQRRWSIPRYISLLV
jgi:Fe-S cluster assembly ATPase SufC